MSTNKKNVIIKLWGLMNEQTNVSSLPGAYLCLLYLVKDKQRSNKGKSKKINLLLHFIIVHIF